MTKSGLKVVRIEAEALATSELGKVCEEAATMASSHGCLVEFEFNGIPFEFDSGSDPAVAVSEYHKRMTQKPIDGHARTRR